MAVSLRSSIAKRRSHLNAALVVLVRERKSVSYFVPALLIATVYVITQYVSRAEGKVFRVEAGKIIVSAIIVFSSLYVAQFLNEQSQKERDSELVTQVLYIARNEIDDTTEILRRLPDELSKAVDLNSEYTVEMLMNDNVIEIPPIVDSALSDINILRTIHPQSASALYVALSNSKSALYTLHNRNINRQSFYQLVEQANAFLGSLSEFMKYELMLQQGVVNEEEFFDLHKAHNKKVNKHTTSTAYQTEN
ncbi:hypothetical protein BSZ04_14735 [Vibrio rotiferianus]|nr:hypothetical protein BSZ04_14735 [Vibrio rotiferianus]